MPVHCLPKMEPKMEKLCTVSKSSQELTVSDHELLIAKFRLKLKKVGKATRPLKYDLNQIPYSTSDKHTVDIQGTYSRSDR